MLACVYRLLKVWCLPLHQGLWRNGSASDSRSEGWEFETLWPHVVAWAKLSERSNAKGFMARPVATIAADQRTNEQLGQPRSNLVVVNSVDESISRSITGLMGELTN